MAELTATESELQAVVCSILDRCAERLVTGTIRGEENAGAVFDNAVRSIRAGAELLLEALKPVRRDNVTLEQSSFSNGYSLF